MAGLSSHRRYWYRFVVDGIRSDTGTVRTAPAAGAALDRLRIAVAGCQHYERGLFPAWRHSSREAAPDAGYPSGYHISQEIRRATCQEKRCSFVCGSGTFISITQYTKT